MTDVLIASTEEDAAAVQAAVEHHAEMSGNLQSLVESTLVAARGSDIAAVSLARDRLVDWCQRQLLPYVLDTEGGLHAEAARIDEGRLLATSLIGENARIVDIVEEIDGGQDAVAIASAARALWEVVHLHLGKESELLLPLLVRTPGLTVARLLPEVPSTPTSEPMGGCGSSGGSCGCGEVSDGAHPELDATTIPHAIRHATIFGALDSVAPGAAMVLVAPHDPLPLLAQLEQRSDGGFRVEYLERGPEKWRLLLTRQV